MSRNEYPSLLSTMPGNGRVLDRAVFEDLKMDLLLSEDAISAMLPLCAASDIPVRQKLFDALSESGHREPFKRLAVISGNMQRLYATYKAARSDNEKFYLYVNLMSAAADFYRNAAVVPGEGLLIERFRNFFRDELENEKTQKMCADADNLCEASERTRKNGFRMRGDDLYIYESGSETLVARLEKCARALGLSETRETRPVSIKLNPRMINALAALRPADFTAFREFYTEYADFFDEGMLNYRTELNFCIEVLALFDRVRELGIPICFPKISSERKIKIDGLRDISLIAKDEPNIVPNDVLFDENEPFFYLTGANGGGKTTYLRAIGIAAVLYLSGCPVACGGAEIYPISCVYTHFPRDERFEGEGRFADEENRVSRILENHNGDSLILLNETYSTTSEQTAIELTDKLSKTLHKSGSFGLYITHQHGLGETDVPFLSVIIDSSDENRRTYKIARKRGVSGSFAHDILKKYNLTREGLELRAARKIEGTAVKTAGKDGF